MTEFPIYVEVMRYDNYPSPNNFRPELVLEGTILALDYFISKERANELAVRIASRLGLEAKIKE